jgi:anti-anti-sigma factor
VSATAEATVLPLAGELCVADVPDVRARIEATITAGAQHLVLDLTEVTLVTAAALRVFAATEARLVANGGDLRVRNPSRLARRVLEITGFAHLIQPPAGV